MPSQRDRSRNAELARIRRARKKGVVIAPSGDWKDARLERKPKIDLTGRRFGKLVVISYGVTDRYTSTRNKSGKRYFKGGWVCRCDCGKTSIVTPDSLKSGNTTSCGCACNRLSEVDREEVVRRYLAGETSIKLGEEFRVGFGSILDLVKRRGHGTRSGAEYHRKPVNHDYFAEIDCERKAYWVGFLLSDGCVTNGGVALRLAIKDKDHVERFKIDLGSEHAVTIVPGRVQRPMKGTGQIVRGGPSAHFSVRSDKMVVDLAKVGIVERKSLIAVPPVLRADLQRHFWRGMIDGDGSICGHVRNARGLITPSVRLVGSKAVCNGFADWCSQVTGKRAVLYPQGNVWNATLYGRQQVCQLIRELGYDRCEIALPRKQERAIAILDFKRMERVPKRCSLLPCTNRHQRFGLCQRHFHNFVNVGLPMPRAGLAWWDRRRQTKGE